jgi:hypothetical protein
MATTESDNLNYRGELFLYGKTKAPFLSAISGRAKRTRSWQFPVSQPWTISSGSQDTQSEDTAASAGTATTIARSQEVNVLQIMKYDVEVTFRKQSASGDFSGINVDGSNPVLDEMGFQKKGGLIQLATNIEYSFLQGAYTGVSSSATNTKTRGLKEAITTNTVAGGAAKLSKAMIEELIREMVDSGAPFDNIMVIGNSFQLQKLSDIYGYAPADRTMGGVAIERFLVPGGGVFSTMFSPQMPTDEVYFVDLSFCAPVFMPALFPSDGNVEPRNETEQGADVLWQPTAITAAKRGGFFYTQIGLDHGPEMYHGSITGLATS